ncbi:MAG: hypothetical protein ACFE7E_03625 [Candidatus Hodarchaeota archaeon]
MVELAFQRVTDLPVVDGFLELSFGNLEDVENCLSLYGIDKVIVFFWEDEDQGRIYFVPLEKQKLILYTADLKQEFIDNAKSLLKLVNKPRWEIDDLTLINTAKREFGRSRNFGYIERLVLIARDMLRYGDEVYDNRKLRSRNHIE